MLLLVVFYFVTCKYFRLIMWIRYVSVSFSVLRDRFRSHNNVNKHSSCVNVILLVVRYAKRNMGFLLPWSHFRTPSVTVESVLWGSVYLFLYTVQYCNVGLPRH
jgi:hypothetical protein